MSFAHYTEDVLSRPGAAGAHLFEAEESRRAMNTTLINTPQAAVVRREKPKLIVADRGLSGIRYTSSQL